MKCREIQERMAEYIVGELPEQLAILVSGHLASCGECELWYREVHEGFQEWRDPDCEPKTSSDTPDLVPQVMSRIKHLDEAKHMDMQRNNQTGMKQTVKRSAFYHYAVAASLAFLMLQTGMFQRLSSGISEFNVHMSEQVQSLVQLFSHL